VGASRKVIKAHEPILLDLGICYHGYQADQTRMYRLGKCLENSSMPAMPVRKFMTRFSKMFDRGRHRSSLFEDPRPRGKVGVQGQLPWTTRTPDPFHRSRDRFGTERTAFLAQGQSYPLEEGMVFAVEPKIVFPGEGGVGLEKHPGCHSQRV